MANMKKEPKPGAPADAARTTTQDTPAELRTQLLAARAALTVTQKEVAAASIMRHLETGLAGSPAGRVLRAVSGRRPLIAGFWPMEHEPDLRPLFERWHEQAFDLALPAVKHRAAPLAFLRWRPGSAMRRGAYGIAEPADAAECVPDVLLVPTLGFTEDGDRIGYGGGYYDRTLAALRRAGVAHATVGVAWACAHLPQGAHAPAPHDMPLDAIVNENGWLVPRQGAMAAS